MTSVSYTDRLFEAENLIHQALFELRHNLKERLQSDCRPRAPRIDLGEEEWVPARAPVNRYPIEELFDELRLIRLLEQFQRCSAWKVNEPWKGPEWLDEIIALGPNWAGEPA